jgi:DNA-binding PadR family transcriptional regulator
LSSTPELTLFSYEILGLVGREGAGAHDLLRLAQRGRMLAWAGESQYYTEPKRLARLGYLDARKEPGKTRERTVYRLTDQGLDALRAYARTPVTIPPFKSDALLRLLVADLVGEKSDRGAADLPHREKYLHLVYGFLRGLLDLHQELVDDVEREL